jgi:hypothetical protein
VSSIILGLTSCGLDIHIGSGEELLMEEIATEAVAKINKVFPQVADEGSG